MSVSVAMEDEDVLQLLTGEDEFDADIDEMAEEELLRDDVVTDVIRNQMTSSQNNVSTNKSIDDEEEEEDRDSARRGRFRSERIMSLASVPTRRREIPDSLDSINVKLDKSSDKNNYNNRRHNTNQQNYRNFNQNPSNGSQNQRQQMFRTNRGLLPLPNQSMAQTSQQQRMILMPPNVYGQQMANNSNAIQMNTIHVNPHFRARMGNQFEHMSQGVRPQQSPEPQMRLSPNVMMGSHLHFPTQQTVNNSQQMLFNPQINNQFRPHFMSNNQYNDQSHNQMAPPLQHQLQPPHQPLLHHPQQPPPHQIQMESHWRPPTNVQTFQMAPNLGQPQHLMPQQMPMNRLINANPIMSGPTQPNFNPTYDPFPSYQSNQPLLMTPNNGPPFQPQNNFINNFQSMENQRFPIHQNYNKMGFGSQQSYQSTNNQQMIPNNITVNQMTPSNQSSPQKPPNISKRPNIHFESGVRPYNSLVGANDPQKSEAIKAAQMRTKRAKHLLSKKQNVVKEVQIVKTPVVGNASNQNQNKEIEAAVGVDEEYKKKLEEQKRLREEILRTKEERRKAMAAQRLKETETKSGLQTNRNVDQKSSQPQQQIATLLNRSPQPTSGALKAVPFKRIVKPITNEKSNISKPVINRLVINNNPNQKRSVLIKGLAASTTELALRRLCKPIGAIESCKICVNSGQKTAIVTFVRSQDAIQFQKHWKPTL